MSQQQLRIRVLQNVADAFFRVFRVDRHVGTASFQNRQNANDRLQRSPDHQAYQLIGQHADRSQRPRQPVRPFVQLRVRKPPPLKDNRRRFGHPLRLLLHELMNRPITGIVLLGIVKALQQLKFLVFRQHVRPHDVQLQLVKPHGQQAIQMADDPSHKLGVI